MKRILLTNKGASPGGNPTPEIPVIVKVGMLKVGALYTQPEPERAGVEKVGTLLKKATLLGMLALLGLMMWAGPAAAVENGLIYWSSNSIGYVDPTASKPEPTWVTTEGDSFDISQDRKTLVYQKSYFGSGMVGPLYTFPLGVPNASATEVQIWNKSSNSKELAYPRFSPDGETIYFVGRHTLDPPEGVNDPTYDTYAIYSVPTSGGEATKLPINISNGDGTPTSISSFALSHDGTKFALGAKGGIFTVPVSGGDATRVTNDLCGSASNPNYSADDQMIVYNADIWSGSNCTGTRRATIYTTPANNDGTAPGKALFPEDATDAYPSYKLTKYYPSYSPDGKYIAFSYWPVGDADPDHVAIVPATGGDITSFEGAPCSFCYPLWIEKPSDTTAPDTTITSKPTNPTNSNTASFSFTSDETGATFECSNDNQTWTTCTSPYNYSSTPLQDGSHNFYVRAKDAAGNVDKIPASYSWTLDTAAPVAKAPAQTFPTNSTLGTSTTGNSVPVKLTWPAATDNTGGSGIASYQLQQSVNGGTYTDVKLPSATTTTITPSLTPSATYSFRVAAKDKAGNVSAWSYGPSFKVSAYQESSSSIVDTGTWTTSTLSGSYGGSVQYASALGRNATFTIPAGTKNVEWVSTKASNRGKAQVWLDGIQQDANPSSTGTQPFDLYSSSTQLRRVVFSKAVSSATSHKLEIRVLGQKNSASTGGTRVDIDAFVTTN